VQYELRARLARYHPLGEGNEQAGRSSPQPRRESTPHATTTTLQLTHPTKNAKLRLKHMTGPARHPPLGEGYVQAGTARAKQGIYRPRTATALDDERPAEKSCRAQIAAGARKWNYNFFFNFAVNTRPYKKRKDQSPGHDTGCTTPSPRGTIRAGWRRQSGAIN